MEAKTWTLGEILKPERRYIIPTFQRSYEWTREGQWELLFADLVATAERLHHRRQYATLTGTQPEEASVSPHFLGAIVCDTLPFPAGGVALRSVIDGQQRLTTIQLLLRGLLDVVSEAEEAMALRGKAKALIKMISNDEDSATAPEDVYKLWPRRDDRRLWPAVISDTVPVYTKTDHLYLQARRYFAEATREVLSDSEGDVRAERLRAMVDAVDTLFKLVVIDLDQNDDAQVIFEVLNGRQQSLSASDLVKNLIFLRAEFAKAQHLDELYDRYWAGFDDEWWKVKVGTGHAQRYRRDVLLSVWLTATTGSDVSVGNLYGEVRSYLDQARPGTEELLADLRGFANAYEEIYGARPVSDGAIRVAYDRLIELGNLTAVPVLAWLRTLPEWMLSAEQHRRAVQVIESFTVRRMIAGWGTRNYGATFVRVMRDARSADPGSICDAIIQALVSAGWPTDLEIEHAMSTGNFYSLARFRQRLILGGIDQRMRDEDPKQAPATVDYGRLQIEHVLPDKWEAHWPLPPGLDEIARVRAKESRDLAKNRIGNLTLVTPYFNGSVSNLAWTMKRPEFAKQSSIMLNVAVAAVDTWNEDAIDTRGRLLAQLAAKVWPSPPADASGGNEGRAAVDEQDYELRPHGLDEEDWDPVPHSVDDHDGDVPIPEDHLPGHGDAIRVIADPRASTSTFLVNALPATSTQFRHNSGGSGTPQAEAYMRAMRELASWAHTAGHAPLVHALVHLGWCARTGSRSICPSANSAAFINGRKHLIVGAEAAPQVVATMNALATTGAPDRLLRTIWSTFCGKA